MNFNFEKPFSREWVKRYLLILQGSLISAAGYAVFLIPNRIVPGGLYGIGTVLYHMFSMPVGTVVFVMNIPLIIWGMKVLGPRFGAKTIVGITLTSVFTDMIIYVLKIPVLSDDPFISSIIGGFLVGYGVSLIFKTMGTTGGVEIVAQILQAKFRLSVGRSILFMNGTIVCAGAFVFRDINLLIYSGISIFMISKMIDVVLEGVSYYKGVFILSEKYEEIKQSITGDLNRNLAMLGEGGMFNDSERRIIFTAVNRRELAFLRDYINRIDGDAFVMVFNSQEVMGRGYESFH